MSEEAQGASTLHQGMSTPLQGASTLPHGASTPPQDTSTLPHGASTLQDASTPPRSTSTLPHSRSTPQGASISLCWQPFVTYRASTRSPSLLTEKMRKEEQLDNFFKGKARIIYRLSPDLDGSLSSSEMSLTGVQALEG